MTKEKMARTAVFGGIFILSALISSITCDAENGIKQRLIEVSRKRKEDLMSQIAPNLLFPFMTSLMFLPVMITGMKFMLANSLILGKLAIILAFINLLRNWFNRGGGVYSHNLHYGNAHQHHGLEGI